MLTGLAYGLLQHKPEATMPISLSQRLSRIVWLGALWDLLLTLPFATTWTAQAMIDLLRLLQMSLGLSGELPVFEPMHLIFVNLFGTVVTLWALIRLRDPQPHYGLADGIGRLAFAGWMALYLWGYGGTQLLGAYLVFELIWSGAHLHAWWRARGVTMFLKQPSRA